jgi:hypothetical protein
MEEWEMCSIYIYILRSSYGCRCLIRKQYGFYDLLYD